MAACVAALVLSSFASPTGAVTVPGAIESAVVEVKGAETGFGSVCAAVDGNSEDGASLVVVVLVLVASKHC